MIKLTTIQTELEKWAPPAVAESYDNVGLLIGDKNMDVQSVLCTLEITEEVLEEAITLGVQLIVSHHPIWFGKRYTLTDENWTGKLMLRAIRANISLYALHTNLDNVMDGVNRKIADKIGLRNIRFLQPRPQQLNVGSGLMGKLVEPMEVKPFLQLLSTTFHSPCIRYSNTEKASIETVAVCGGAGSFLIEDALKLGVDAFITGDVTHHKFFEGQNKLLIVDIGHFESEQFTAELIADFIKNKCRDIHVYVSEVNTNPVSYFIRN